MTTSAVASAKTDDFQYANERFADLQMLRYKVEGFENLSLRQKTLIYYLSEAALWGRDILCDQNGRYNLRVRRTLEAVYENYAGGRGSEDFKALEVYLKRVWFSNGIHHHYGCEKFVPGFSEAFFRTAVKSIDSSRLPLADGQTADGLLDEICPVMFRPEILSKRVNLAGGEDLIKTSASNYYENVSQEEAEDYYTAMKNPDDSRPVMYGMNSRLVKTADGQIVEKRWTADGLYGEAIKKIVEYLKLARPYAEDEGQQKVIDKLVEYYTTGDLNTFDEYSILWVKNTEPLVDFVNGFIECYGDPLGLKCSWESIVNFKDMEATKRTEILSGNAQWFEDHSPVDGEFKKEEVKGITAKVINAAILGGDLYPSTAIGINLPNSDWVRKEHGSKSVTIGNLTEAYNRSAAGNGFRDEFVWSKKEVELMDKYADITDDLHTDLHECLGHGSGKLLPGVDPDSLKAYGSTIEEARADLFALYYLADDKLTELGLVPDAEAYKAQYYSYMMNGLMTQLVRIAPGNNIEEAHMRNRAVIARWVYERGSKDKVVELVKREGKTYVKINDYVRLRELFGALLAEVQRIKSTGDFLAAQNLVENYGVKIDAELHEEILARYRRLDIAPYKGFINPVYTAVKDGEGNIVDVKIDYTEGYAEQMLRYSRDYSVLPSVNE
ncbi:MAG: dipeptidyl peptidase 3 [Bacteroides sp.]|nr:dipeptidyl peptidase 3 [Bacteroides sp.]MCM1421368.1 dipeptidyl peptidase 3 [Bacteroides sp.]